MKGEREGLERGMSRGSHEERERGRVEKSAVGKRFVDLSLRFGILYMLREVDFNHKRALYRRANTQMFNTCLSNMQMCVSLFPE